ncbi:class II aldolase/adducin family protein [Shigella flexneri]
MVIKPGVAYDTMTTDDVVVVDSSGKVVEGEYRPSSDTATHLDCRRYPSTAALSMPTPPMPPPGRRPGWRLPAWGTTHADYFYGAIPCTRGLAKREEVQGEYELNAGEVIIETLGNASRCHTPGDCGVSARAVRLGEDPHDAVHNAVVMEEVAKMA